MGRCADSCWRCSLCGPDDLLSRAQRDVAAVHQIAWRRLCYISQRHLLLGKLRQKTGQARRLQHYRQLSICGWICGWLGCCLQLRSSGCLGWLQWLIRAREGGCLPRQASRRGRRLCGGRIRMRRCLRWL